MPPNLETDFDAAWCIEASRECLLSARVALPSRLHDDAILGPRCNTRTQAHWRSSTLALSQTRTQQHWHSAALSLSRTRTQAHSHSAKAALSNTRTQPHSHSGALALRHTRSQPHSHFRFYFLVTNAPRIMLLAVFLSVYFLRLSTSTQVQVSPASKEKSLY